MDREAWRAAVHEVTKSWTWLSNIVTSYVQHSDSKLLDYIPLKLL